jgi:hypothetical protein
MADCAAIPALFYAQVVSPFDVHANILLTGAAQQGRRMPGSGPSSAHLERQNGST